MGRVPRLPLTRIARRPLVGLLIALVALACALALVAPVSAQRPFPDVVRLPNGFQPEGIATGRGPSFYVGSIPTGAVYVGSLRSGKGEILVAPRDGRSAVGIQVDARNRLWVSGGETGQGYVYDARTGRELGAFTFLPAGQGFVNDVAVTRDAGYFTDSRNQRLYVVPIEGRRRFGAPRQLPLTGEIAYGQGFNANGIDATASGGALVLVQTNAARLFRVDPETGAATAIDLGGTTLPNGDGVLLRGRTLYVAQNRLNQVAVIRLSADLARGELVGTLTRPELDVPTTTAVYRGGLYAVNARFGTPPGPDVRYDVVRLPLRPAR
jgi:hypothetical protein